MKKTLILVGIAIGLLTGCSEDTKETKKEVAAVEKEPTVKEESKQEEFNPEEFLKEAEQHGMEWYVAESAKLTPEEISVLEKYQADLAAKELEAYQSILDQATTKETVNDEGQKVIEYKMVNTLGNDVEFFQLGWVEGTGENVSQTADNIQNGQEFTLIVDPAFDKTLEDIDLTTLSLTGSIVK